MTLNSNITKRGPSSFKINNSILLNPEYQNKIRNSITEIVQFNAEANPNTLWELMKGRIRDETIKYSAQVKRDQNKTEQEIINNIHKLEHQLIINVHDNTVIDKLNMEKQKLDNINECKIKGIIIRAKAEYVEGMEKNTKYFANLEKKKTEQKNIKHLKINGSVTENQFEILNHAMEYYKNLYMETDQKEINSDIFSDKTNTLSNNLKQQCEGLLNEYECQNALKEMNNNKSPGSDGISVEFYKTFWNEIKMYFVNSINYSHNEGHLTSLTRYNITST